MSTTITPRSTKRRALAEAAFGAALDEIGAAAAPAAPVDPAFPFATVDDMRRANVRAGQYFFSPGAMRFFSSRIHDRVYGGGVFVTSERDEWSGRARRYSVRMTLPSGAVETVGDFESFATSATAHRYAAEVGRVYAEHFAPVAERAEAERRERDAAYRARMAARRAEIGA